MNPELYKATMGGNLEGIVEYKDRLEFQLTPNNNSVLHIAALYSNNSTILVKKILELQPLLLCKVNKKGDTALHIAAREGNYHVVQALIEKAEESSDSELECGIGLAKEILRMVNKDGNMALHEAVWNNKHLEVVNLLVDKDPEFVHPANNAKETPLYLATERGFHCIVSKILNTCASPTYSGPDGRTALHGAVINDHKECTRLLLEWKQSLTKEPDIKGWTPLHYAADYGLMSRVTQLLDADNSVAYQSANEDNEMTPLHIAASRGRIEAMKELISRCPDCWEMVDNIGQNILHLASRNRKFQTMELILKDSKLGSLINQKDDDGDTPLHLLAAFHSRYESNLSLICVSDMIKDTRVDKNPFNKQKRTPLDIAMENRVRARRTSVEKILKDFGARSGRRDFVNRENKIKEEKKKVRDEYVEPLPEDIRKRGDAHLIVAAFIATVTFAAGFTVPGGYDSDQGPDQGLAVLTRAAAFKAFVISDTIAMVLSTCALFLHFIVTSYKEPRKIYHLSATAEYLILLSIGAMLVAFMTSMFAILPHSKEVAISVCSISSLFFVLIFFQYVRFLNDFRGRNWFQRLVLKPLLLYRLHRA